LGIGWCDESVKITLIKIKRGKKMIMLGVLGSDTENV
jgi:hypothetical protein